MTDPAPKQQRYLDDLAERLRRMSWLADLGEDAFFAPTDDGARNRGYGQMLVIQVSTIVHERLDQKFRDRHPSVPWQRIAGMRNRLAHECDAVADEVVWSVLTKHRATLASAVLGSDE